MKATLLVVVLLVLASAVWAQAPAPADDPMEGAALPWRDTVHYVGIAGGGLAFIAVALGLGLYFGFTRPRRPFNHPRRKALRTTHMVVGLAAVGLSLGHHFGRWAQEGGPNFGLEPPHLAGVFFIFLGLAGVLRIVPPKAWRKYTKQTVWVHRASALLALAMLVVHGLQEWTRFQAG